MQSIKLLHCLLHHITIPSRSMDAHVATLAVAGRKVYNTIGNFPGHSHVRASVRTKRDAKHSQREARVTTRILCGACLTGMEYGFTTVTCVLLPREVGRDKARLRSILEPLNFGTWLDLGPRGLRLIPHDPVFPPTYFNPDGTVDLVNTNLYLDDVMTHMERIAAALGCELEWDW